MCGIRKQKLKQPQKPKLKTEPPPKKRNRKTTKRKQQKTCTCTWTGKHRQAYGSVLGMDWAFGVLRSNSPQMTYVPRCVSCAVCRVPCAVCRVSCAVRWCVRSCVRVCVCAGVCACVCACVHVCGCAGAAWVGGGTCSSSLILRCSMALSSPTLVICLPPSFGLQIPKRPKRWARTSAPLMSSMAVPFFSSKRPRASFLASTSEACFFLAFAALFAAAASSLRPSPARRRWSSCGT